MKRFSAAIIGLGQIGQGYDYEQQGDEYIKTHATGLFHHPGFHLIGGVDPDAAQRQKFEKKFNCPVFETPGEMLDRLAPEVVAIAVPTEKHREVFDTSVRSGLRAVICEKPLASRLETAREMVDEAEKKACALLVNYGRRFDPSVLKLKAKIEAGRFGQIYKGVVWYSKGLRNNGSHFVDLLRFLLGEAGGIGMIRAGRSFNGDDPEPDFMIQFGQAVVMFLSAREECFTHCEMELVGTGGSLKYLQGGGLIETRTAEPHPQYPGYRSLEAKGTVQEGCLKQVLLHCYSSLYDHLISGKSLASTGESALKTLETVEAVIDLREKCQKQSGCENLKKITGDSHE